MFIEDKRIIQARSVLSVLKDVLAKKTDKTLAENYRRIIEVICDYYRNDPAKIFKVGMRQGLREVRESEEVLIHKLEREGILCSHNSFKAIGEFIRKLKNAIYGKNVVIESVSPESLFGTFCFENIAALNTYDFYRLKEEISELLERSGEHKLSSISPTLHLILEEKESNGIPGRLPYNQKYPSETMRRYQRLRILDDILAEALSPLSNADIIHKLESRLSKECGINKIGRDIKRPNDFDAMLKNDFKLLANLISIEAQHGEKQAYERKGVYDLSVKGHHRYLDEVRAFELVLTDREAYQINKELGSSVVGFRMKRSDFSWRFPMLEALRIYGRSYDPRRREEPLGLETEKQNDSPIYTINYYGPEYADLYEEIEKRIYERRPFVLTPIGDSPRLYYPLSIKRDGSKWVVIASDSENQRLHSLTPEHIRKAIEDDCGLNRDLREFYSEYLVGLSAPDEGFESPLDVTLTLTSNGYKNLLNSGVYFIRKDWTGNSSISEDSSQKDLEITVYLDEDFYQNLKWQADHDNLIDITPLGAKRWFEKRYMREGGGKRKEWNPEAAMEKALNGTVSRSTSDRKRSVSK